MVFLGIQGAGRVCEMEEEASTFPTLSTHVLERPSEDHYWRARFQEGLPSLHPGGNKNVNTEFWSHLTAQSVCSGKQ